MLISALFVLLAAMLFSRRALKGEGRPGQRLITWGASTLVDVTLILAAYAAVKYAIG